MGLGVQGLGRKVPGLGGGSKAGRKGQGAAGGGEGAGRAVGEGYPWTSERVISSTASKGATFTVSRSRQCMMASMRRRVASGEDPEAIFFRSASELASSTETPSCTIKTSREHRAN